MNTRRKSAIFAFATAAILAIGSLASCDQNAGRDTEIESMEERLNAIIAEHEQMKSDYENYAGVLAEKDSAINAQAAEIRSLISQLKAAKAAQGSTGKAVRKSAVKDNSVELARLSEEIAAKQQQIADLEARLQKQQDNAAAMQQGAAAGQPATPADRRQLERMQRQVSDQDALIAQLTNDVVRLTNDNDSLVSQNAYLTKHQGSANEGTYTAQIAQLQQQVSTQQAEIERLQSELTQKQAAVDEAKKAVEKAQSDAKAKAKTSVNKKIKELQGLCDSYAQEIERLRAENAQLRTENESLRGQVDDMRQEAAQTAEKNAKLADKVSRASILVTKDLQVTPLKVGSNGIGKETNRAASTSSLMLDGAILDNNVVEPGTIQLYARVVGSTGRVLEAITADGTSPLFDANGTQILYTMTQAVEFTGEGRTFRMTWNRGEKELVAGIYKLTLYANGNIIGTTTFRLK